MSDNYLKIEWLLEFFPEKSFLTIMDEKKSNIEIGHLE